MVSGQHSRFNNPSSPLRLSESQPSSTKSKSKLRIKLHQSISVAVEGKVHWLKNLQLHCYPTQWKYTSKSPLQIACNWVDLRLRLKFAKSDEYSTCFVIFGTFRICKHDSVYLCIVHKHIPTSPGAYIRNPKNSRYFLGVYCLPGNECIVYASNNLIV